MLYWSMKSSLKRHDIGPLTILWMAIISATERKHCALSCFMVMRDVRLFLGLSARALVETLDGKGRGNQEAVGAWLLPVSRCFLGALHNENCVLCQ